MSNPYPRRQKTIDRQNVTAAICFVLPKTLAPFNYDVFFYLKDKVSYSRAIKYLESFGNLKNWQDVCAALKKHGFDYADSTVRTALANADFKCGRCSDWQGTFQCGFHIVGE